MKRIFLLLIVFLMAQGCTNNSTYSIEAFTDHEDGKKVYLFEVGKDNNCLLYTSTSPRD